MGEQQSGQVLIQVFEQRVNVNSAALATGMRCKNANWVVKFTTVLEADFHKLIGCSRR